MDFVVVFLLGGGLLEKEEMGERCEGEGNLQEQEGQSSLLGC